MTQTEALRLALEALSTSMYPQPRQLNAIAAIKAALEAKDEPVACKECHLKDTVYDLLDDLKVANLKLSVRSQRTWVGLTDEEIDDLHMAVKVRLMGTFDTKDIYRAVEAKLKEKNNG